MSITEKYWLTVLMMLCRYFSIIMFMSGIAFIITGVYVNHLWFIGLASWPLFIMLGITNLQYIRAVEKSNGLQFSKILSANR